MCLGSVKIDIHKDESKYKHLSLSDINTIKLLIQYRKVIDPYYKIKVNYNIFESGDVKPLNQELIATYIDLDTLIDKTKLNEKQLYIIRELMDGATEEDIAEEFGQYTHRITNMVDTICQRLKDTNDYLWKHEYIYLNHKKVEWNYKKCSKCGESLPATTQFFAPDRTGKYNLRSICRYCRD